MSNTPVESNHISGRTQGIRATACCSVDALIDSNRMSTMTFTNARDFSLMCMSVHNETHYQLVWRIFCSRPSFTRSLFYLLAALAVKGSGHIRKLNLCSWNAINMLNLLESRGLMHVALSMASSVLCLDTVLVNLSKI